MAGRWRDLAIKSGYSYSSGMAMPSGDLPRGTVCVPHLSEGDVILTRYPFAKRSASAEVVNSDNSRLYCNSHDPELKKTRNVIWINPKDAEEYHQKTLQTLDKFLIFKELSLECFSARLRW